MDEGIDTVVSDKQYSLLKLRLTTLSDCYTNGEKTSVAVSLQEAQL